MPEKTAAVRRATLEDAAAIAAVHVSSWQAAYSGLMPDEFLSGLSVPARTESWAENLANPSLPHTVLVASEAGSGETAGFAVFGPGRDDDTTPETGELSAIYLLPAQWGNGLGRALHEECVRGLAARFETATLWVLSANERARKFYERAGWVSDGRTKVETMAEGTVPIEEIRYRLSLRD
ncbi:GNAT family N-acetyltransferase [Amycolatopsis benzoatilytica]|uniref:GNAT family N-acetyltransferase n=1 Tax=Amycolatopsis benzoatilytica TaxID=346045 RepID=UPI00036C62B1|nr:GNAT family N-acetyltransferase [Amycolatopsis benzoatilytica]